MAGTPTVDGATFMGNERLRWLERKFQAAIIESYVGTRRRPVPNPWKAYHSYFSDRSEAGWPDLVLVRERIVYVELKTMKGAVTPAQREWHDALVFAGGETYVWRPCCWNSGEIERVLR